MLEINKTTYLDSENLTTADEQLNKDDLDHASCW